MQGRGGGVGANYFHILQPEDAGLLIIFQRGVSCLSANGFLLNQVIDARQPFGTCFQPDDSGFSTRRFVNAR